MYWQYHIKLFENYFLYLLQFKIKKVQTINQSGNKIKLKKLEFYPVI